MAADTTTWDWEPVDAVRVEARGATWTTALALAQHAAAYYLRVQTAKAGAHTPARVCIDGPYPDVMRALARARSLINNVRSTIGGATYASGADPPREGRPNIAMHPPDYESWAWEVLETRQVQMGNEMWIVQLALAA